MRAAVFVAAVLLVALGPELAQAQMLLRSPEFDQNTPLPDKYACDYEERDRYRPSPPLEWFRVPAKTQSFVLIADDVDDGNKVLWLAKDIPRDTISLPADATETDMPAGTVELPNSFGTEAYAAPCQWNATHTIRFRLLAMPTRTTDLGRLFGDPVRLPNLNVTIEGTADPVPYTSDHVTSLIENDALYVATLHTSIFVPAQPYRVPERWNITIHQWKELHIYGKYQPSCEWVVADYDETMMKFLSSTMQYVGATPYTRMAFEALNLGYSDIVLDHHCFGFRHRHSVAIRVKIIPFANITKRIYIDAKWHVRDKLQRYVKPSEVLKPQRPHAVLEYGVEEMDCGDGRNDECHPDLFDNQALMATNEEQEDALWKCDAERTYARFGRTSSGDRCGLRGRFADANCATTASFPAQHTCLTSVHNSNNSYTTSNYTPSPSVVIRDAPEGTQSFAIVVEDVRQANYSRVAGEVVWAVADIPVETTAIVAGASGTELMPPLSVEYPTRTGLTTYSPPCPHGDEAHVIRLRVFAMPHRRSFIRLQRQRPQDIVSQLTSTALCTFALELPLSRATAAASEAPAMAQPLIASMASAGPTPSALQPRLLRERSRHVVEPGEIEAADV